MAEIEKKWQKVAQGLVTNGYKVAVYFDPIPRSGKTRVTVRAQMPNAVDNCDNSDNNHSSISTEAPRAG